MRFSRSWVALKSQLFETSTVVHQVVKLIKVFDPVVSQIKVDKLCLALHAFYLPNEVVIQVNFAQLLI